VGDEKMLFRLGLIGMYLAWWVVCFAPYPNLTPADAVFFAASLS
jgi:hypothetical protein